MAPPKRSASAGPSQQAKRIKAAATPSMSQEDAFMAAGGKQRPPAFDIDDLSSDDEIISSMMDKYNAKEGRAAVKSAVGKGKQKEVKASTGGGSFQSMGLNPNLLRSLILRGYKTPTPIQRQAVPAALSAPPRDLVGMARTGSGKTLAYMIPLVQKLQGRHSTKFGPRGLILCPGRELAVQILKVGKEMCKGFRTGGGRSHAGDDDEKDAPTGGDDVRWGLVVGGESLDEQFEMIASNPDVIIATPGRLLHLIIEMNLDLRSVEYVVFDEADRLFEMGFEIQLQEILHRLPSTRQTLLFSATLPKNLVEFAKAGLQNPRLIRLDSEAKISADLQMSFFSVKPAEKEAALLCLLKDAIGVPYRDPDDVDSGDEDDVEDDDKSGKGGKKPFKKREHRDKKFPQTKPHQVMIFTATKHHVDYLATILITAGYSVSHIYGSLDQTARKRQMDRFRRGRTNILVVTDVAARGIDIPVLENVVNYDFPTGSRVFVHRVGRTARAGRSGSAWSFVTHTELPYFLDLQLFLGRSLVNCRSALSASFDASASIYLGTIPRDSLDTELEYCTTSLIEAASNIPILKEVVRKGQAMYERSQGKASQESYRRAKEMSKDPTWGLAGSIGEEASVHPSFRSTANAQSISGSLGSALDNRSEVELAAARATLLASVNSFRPTETVFEIGARGKNATFQLMQDRRKALGKAIGRGAKTQQMLAIAPVNQDNEDSEEEEDGKKEDYRDSEYYMSHYQSAAENDTKGYSMTDGASFAEQAKSATFDLTGDDGIVTRVQRASQLTWDKKKKKFIQGDGVGADNKKIVRTESGARLPATFKSGRFDEWKAKKRVDLPKTGEAENPSNYRGSGGDGRRFRHNKVTEAKPLDKRHNMYEKKVQMINKKKREAEEGGGDIKKGGRGGRFAGGKSVGAVKNEIKSVDQIRKSRNALEARKAKNARPSKKGGKGGGKKGGRR